MKANSQCRELEALALDFIRKAGDASQNTSSAWNQNQCMLFWRRFQKDQEGLVRIIMADEECLLDDPLSVAERKFKLFAQTKLFKAEVSIEASKD